MAIDKQVQPMESPIPLDEFSGPMEIELELLGEEGEMMPEEMPVEQGPQFNENLADFLESDVLSTLGSELTALYSEDKESRQDWYESFRKGLDLLGIKQEERTHPFQGSSGVNHPLLAEAVTQFQSQAYK